MADRDPEQAVELPAKRDYVDLTADPKKDKSDEKGKDGKKPAGPQVPYHRLYRFADHIDFFLVLFGSLGAMGHGVIQPLFAVIFGNVINAFSPESLANGGLLSTIEDMAKWFVILGACNFATSYIQVSCFMTVAQRQANRIRKAYFRAITRQEMGWFDTQEVGSLTARIAGDIIVIQDGMGEKVGNGLQFFAMFVAGFVVAFVNSWKMSLVILAVTPLLMVCGGFMGKLMEEFSTQGQKAYADAGGIAEEAISSLRTVAAFSGELLEQNRYGVALKRALTTGVKKGHISGGGLGITFFIMFASYGLAFWYGATLINSGELDAGTVTSVFFAMMIGSMAIGQATPSMTAVANAKGAAYEIFQLIDRTPKIDALNDEGKKPAVTGNIEFRNVQFTYPSRPEAQILKGLNLTVKAGTTVALVGPSGCGKSTTVGLLERFYDSDSGEVLIDGVNVRDYSLPYLRSQIGMVNQEPNLFATSVRQNILYGRPDATQAEIEAAAKNANAHDFISRLPKGYETTVGERGGQLSGGQKQRVAIARALLKNPKILLLDEATSALDNKSEKVVQRALDQAAKGRTTIIIAHRLSTVRNADRIVVIQNGQVAEEGNHDELMALGGLYKDLVERQAAVQTEEGSKKSSGELEVDQKDTKNGDDEEDSIEETPSTTPPPEEEDEATGWFGRKKKPANPEEGRVMGRVMRLTADDWVLHIIGFLGACGAGVVFPLFSIIFSDLLQDLLTLTGQPLIDRAVFWALMFLALAVGNGISSYLNISMYATLGERLTDKIRHLTFGAILRQDVGWFDLPDHATGALATKLSSDATLIQSLATQRVGLSVQAIVTLGAGLIIALVSCWRVALVVLACTPIVGIGGLLQFKAMMGFNLKAKKAYEKSGTIASECIGNMRTVASLSLESTFYDSFKESLAMPNRAAKRNAHVSAVGLGFAEMVALLIFALAFWYGAQTVDEGTCDFSGMFKAINAIVFGAMMAGQLSSMAPDAGKAKAAALGVFQILDRVPPIDNKSTDGEKPSHVTGTVTFNQVRFHYPTRPTVPILRGLDLTIPAGKTVALVGSSGCGKSTCIQLLERFYDPISGNVQLDGVDIKQLNVQWLRSQVGLVQQEPILFGTTIGQNIAYGKPGASQQEIEEAAKQANAHNFIMSLPDKYDTFVGEKGAQLSGGQKQRVAIARALIRNPKILLLDEATSALDAESEHIVQEALDKARLGRTTILIAHRLSTVQTADMIVVVDQGQVIEAGTHAELIAKEGFYYSLVNSQVNPT